VKVSSRATSRPDLNQPSRWNSFSTKPGITSRNLHPRLVASTIIGASRVSVDYWLDSHPTATSIRTYVPVLRQALRQVAVGLPVLDSTKAGPRCRAML